MRSDWVKNTITEGWYDQYAHFGDASANRTDRQSESDELRNAFIQAFVRKVPNIYHEHIEKVIYRDGLPYYSGFLWEFLYDRGKTDTVPISEEDGLRLLETYDTVLFMFDLFYYESDRQRPKVPPFDRPDWQHLVYKAKASCLPKLIWESWNGDPRQMNAAPDSPVALPESVYVFDESFSWFVAFTEENNGQDRICFCCKHI